MMGFGLLQIQSGKRGSFQGKERQHFHMEDVKRELAFRGKEDKMGSLLNFLSDVQQ